MARSRGVWARSGSGCASPGLGASNKSRMFRERYSATFPNAWANNEATEASFDLKSRTGGQVLSARGFIERAGVRVLRDNCTRHVKRRVEKKTGRTCAVVRGGT